jgi:oligopeptide/dipeptide ABC transporter ATP-binding protein
VNKVQSDNLLEVRNLEVSFPVTRGLLRKQIAELKAVAGVTFSVRKGEVLGLVGESGCGKTTLGRSIIGLYRPSAGQILFEGLDLANHSEEVIRETQGKMALIFQDPYGSLDPRQNVGSIVGEPLKIHRFKGNKGEHEDKVEDLFRIVGLDPAMMNRFPHEFSGGQKQRIGIARALACDPSLIICDEPVSALDVSIQAQVINLLEELQGRLGLTYLFIAHDLAVVKHISHRVAVMYLGHVIELTGSKELYDNPLHPYSQALLSAVPIADPFVEKKRERIILKGEVPSPLNPPSGCCFHPRCFRAIPECAKEIPPLRDVGDRHEVACIRV